MQQDFVLEILKKNSPEANFSSEVVEEIQNCIRNFVSGIGKSLSAIAEDKNKDIVDIDDFNSLLDSIKEGGEECSNSPYGSPNRGKLKASTDNMPLSKFFLQVSQNSTQGPNLPLFKRNNGHSAFVKNWILEHNKSHLLVAVVGNAGLLKKIFESIKDNCGQGEVNLECDNKGIQVQALGNANVSILSVDLRCDGFEFYSCEENLVLGVGLIGVTGFLKQSMKSDQVTILYSNGCKECTFVLEDGIRITVFEMRLKNMDKPALVLTDEIDYPVEWKMSTVSFHRICKDLKASVSDIAIIVNENGNLSFEGSGHYGRIQMVCNVGINFFKISPCLISFSSAYLSNFSKAALLSSSVTIRIGQNLPFMASFEILGIGSVKYYLAYRVDSSTGK